MGYGSSRNVYGKPPFSKLSAVFFLCNIVVSPMTCSKCTMQTASSGQTSATSSETSSGQTSTTGLETSGQSGTDSPASSTTGLTTAAAAGIGIGTGAAVFLFACGGWVLYRRGVAAGRIENRGHGSASSAEHAKSPQNELEGDRVQPFYQPPSELDYRNERPCEMGPGSPRPHELA